MLYLNKKELEKIGINWHQLLDVIRNTLYILRDQDVVQPVKPYLRYSDLSNRIIAMPAYVGGNIATAGIKWIASFPRNLDKGLARAHSVTILNEAETGVPRCIFNTALVSGIRTAAVSGVLVDAYLLQRPEQDKICIGIIGFGPIGQLHLQMLAGITGNRELEIRIFDLQGVDLEKVPARLREHVTVCGDWESAYKNADIFITCTVSKKPYINLPPKKGSLQLNVSLRDYVPEYRSWVDMIIIDDWDEVCRENTDIENMHLKTGLQQKDTITLTEVICGDLLKNKQPDDIIMFNPMGMAIFDIAIASEYYHLAMELNAGVLLED
ncbi:hypothetical protein ACFSNA_02780 [Pedobacter mendelii]|uniref:hypothetical protein n=1 Tax=Pedobacter mendelii TaxID=1908240 RepID=UPI00360B704B